jgi:hypothetical protein
VTNCQKWTTPNTENLYTKGYYLTARTGTHHIIVYRADPNGSSFRNVEDGQFPAGDQRGTDLSFMVGAQSGLGAGGLILDARTVAPEYENWAAVVQPGTRVCYEAHYVNATDEDLLRESWVKFDLIPEDQVEERQAAIFALGGLLETVAPGAHRSWTGECVLPASNPGPIEILGMTGHMHAAGQRQTVWKRHLDGTREKIYETFDWAEPLNAQYDSVTINPEFSPETKSDGATSGRMVIQPGEKIQWECEFINSTDGTLRFGNGAYDAEMCNVFGFYGPAIQDRNGVDQPWRCFNLLNVDISE